MANGDVYDDVESYERELELMVEVDLNNPYNLTASEIDELKRRAEIKDEQIDELVKSATDHMQRQWAISEQKLKEALDGLEFCAGRNGMCWVSDRQANETKTKYAVMTLNKIKEIK